MLWEGREWREEKKDSCSRTLVGQANVALQLPQLVLHLLKTGTEPRVGLHAPVQQFHQRGALLAKQIPACIRRSDFTGVYASSSFVTQ